MNLKEKAYNIIKRRIIDGVYHPGQMLIEKEIIDELQISRTPFREAINSLVKEHLVTIFPKRGMFVAEITIKDISDIYNIRDVLEPLAVRLAIKNIPKDILLKLQDSMMNFNYKSYDEIIRDDEDLHGVILRYADNAYLSRMMENLYAHNNRVRVLSTRSEDDVQKTIEQHKTIIGAMLDGDVEETAKQMQLHIRDSKERALIRIFNNGNISIR